MHNIIYLYTLQWMSHSPARHYFRVFRTLALHVSRHRHAQHHHQYISHITIYKEREIIKREEDKTLFFFYASSHTPVYLYTISYHIIHIDYFSPIKIYKLKINKLATNDFIKKKKKNQSSAAYTYVLFERKCR